MQSLILVVIGFVRNSVNSQPDCDVTYCILAYCWEVWHYCK